jgi:predicted dehydrogenase
MLRIGVAGCGRVARIHLGRLLARGDVEVVGLADPDVSSAQALGRAVPGAGQAPVFADHNEMLAQVGPDAVAIFAPHRAHYRLAVDALQAGCHVFIEKPLSTNAQEASDIIGLARGRGRTVGVGHHYRLLPSLIEARNRLMAKEIGPVRLIAAALAAPWLARHEEKADAWRLDPRLSGGGILADVGDHLLDALLWLTGQAAAEVAAFQTRHAPGLDVVTSAVIRLADGTPATLSLSGVCANSFFELTFFGEGGRLRVGESSLAVALGDGPETPVSLPAATQTIDGDFVAAIAARRPPCCPAEEAIDTVRLLEAIARSATGGEVVKLA